MKFLIHLCIFFKSSEIFVKYEFKPIRIAVKLNLICREKGKGLIYLFYCIFEAVFRQFIQLWNRLLICREKRKGLMYLFYCMFEAVFRQFIQLWNRPLICREKRKGLMYLFYSMFEAVFRRMEINPIPSTNL